MTTKPTSAGEAQTTAEDSSVVQPSMNAERPPDGGPAFPIVASTGDPRDGVYCESGLSMRDYFAARAMQGFISNQAASQAWIEQHIATSAYNIADMMLAARKESK